MSREDLIASLIRHDYSENNSNVAASRVSRYVDNDGEGNLRLRNTGLRRADGLIHEGSM